MSELWSLRHHFAECAIALSGLLCYSADSENGNTGGDDNQGKTNHLFPDRAPDEPSEKHNDRIHIH
jgi:hypothetical protein